MGFLGWCLPLNSVSLLHISREKGKEERRGRFFSWIFSFISLRFFYSFFFLTRLTFGERESYLSIYFDSGHTSPVRLKRQVKDDGSSVRLRILFIFYFLIPLWNVVLFLFLIQMQRVGPRVNSTPVMTFFFKFSNATIRHNLSASLDLKLLFPTISPVPVWKLLYQQTSHHVSVMTIEIQIKISKLVGHLERRI
jgi:hypothetical protein